MCVQLSGYSERRQPVEGPVVDEIEGQTTVEEQLESVPA